MKALIITAIGLLVGLAGLYVAWRFVRSLAVEDHSPPAGGAGAAPQAPAKPDPDAPDG